MGGVFLRDTTKPFTVKLHGNGAGNKGLRHGSGPSATNTFYGHRAYQTYTVVATFVTEHGNIQSAQLDVTVRPGPPDHLVIETTDDSTGALWNDSPRDLLTLGPSTQSSTVNGYTSTRPGARMVLRSTRHPLQTVPGRSLPLRQVKAG